MRSVEALTYIDEDFNYYSSNRRRDSPTDLPTAPLVANVDLGRQDLGTYPQLLTSISVLNSLQNMQTRTSNKRRSLEVVFLAKYCKVILRVIP